MAFDEHNVPYIAFNGPSGHYTVYKVTNSDLLKKLRQSFTISYYGNGGSGAPKDQTAYVGVEKNLSKTKPTRKNYTFLGWSTNKDAKKASYSAGAKYVKAYGKSNSNVKLYAVWEESKYTITYNANGGSGAPAMQTVGATKTAKLSTTKPTRANYTFLGWSTNKGATAASYQAGAAYNDKKSITLYAVWRTNTYTITYNANGGSGAPVTQNATINQAVTLSATRPVRSGYTFLGWATKQDATSAQYASGAQYTGSKNITLYAVWKQNPAQIPPAIEKITITYDANGGTNVPPATTAEIGKVVITTVQPTRAYFTFLGWSTSRAATTASYQPGASYTGNTSTTLYAVWKQNVVVISYNANGGTNAPANQVVPAGQVARLSAAKPVLSGYTFLGWSPDKNAKEGEYAPNDTITLAVDLVLYAIWERTPNTITFDANAGTNAPLPISTTGEIVLPEDRPVRTGYVFVGWSKDKNATTATYYPGDIIKNPENMTLYAVWQVATPMPIEGQADNENDDSDENINDASAINDGEEDDSVEVSELDPSELPNTGPAEVAVATIALVCICSGAAYWYMSSRQLKSLQKTVRGHHIESRKNAKNN